MLNEPLIFSRICDDGQNLWFPEYFYNALFKICKENGHVELAGIFPNEAFTQINLYSSVVMCNEKLFFSPQRAAEIAVYDLKYNTFQKIQIPTSLEGKTIRQKRQGGKFCNITAIGDKVYFLPNKYPGILCYDTLTGAFSCFDDWVDEIERNRASSWNYFETFEVVEGRLILPCVCADAIVVFDSLSQRTHIIHTSATGHPCKFCGICREGNFLYLLSGDGTVSKRDINLLADATKVFSLPIQGTEVAEFYPMQIQNAFIYLFPFGKNKGFKIDTTTGQILREELLDREKGSKGSDNSFFSSFCYNQKIYSAAGNGRRLMEYDFANGTKREIKLFSSKADRAFWEEIHQKDFVRRALGGCCINENAMESLGYMLDNLPTCENENKAADCRKISVGSKVYRFMTQ
ncbi:MAG: hypothetical protein HDR11_04540 [Lachnospiraceae bacterium]|nr:hypothetical protein [Lachnospiraceae bacterium]MBD5497022.1 hypothetical protein [Lachnospiraceae bacterium]